MTKFIPLSVPNIKGNEKKYINEAIDTEWVSSAGPHIIKFEENFRKYLSVSASCACQSGTAGLHLCLAVMDIKDGDIVLVPTLTFIATINAVIYQRATPVFVDCDDSLGINVDRIIEYLENDCYQENGKTFEKQSKKQVKAVIPVHVFGNACQLERLMEVAKKYDLKVIEDATESLGTYFTEGSYKGRYTGTIADAGVFSFNGNKIMTTGGGGMVVSNNQDLIDRVRYLSTQAKDDVVYFIHDHVGYNYRLTNVQAALGLGQLEQIEQFIETKKNNYLLYKELLKNSKLGYILDFDPTTRPNYWFYSFVLNTPNADMRDKLIQYMADHNVQTRPVWKLNHTQKPFVKYNVIGGDIAQSYYDSIVNIPCSTNLEANDVKRVCELILEFEDKYYE